MEEEISVVPIHKHREYLLECCKLINDEWKRSETARLRSLESSCDYLPTNLILLKDKIVIGHVKLSLIPSMKDACFVESVVIHKKLRGQGFGSLLMKETENYCQNHLHLNIIYLSTKGQEKFYEKLGYQECEPISLYGGYFPRNIPKSVNVNTSGPPAPPMPQNKFSLPQTQQKTYMCKLLNNNCA